MKKFFITGILSLCLPFMANAQLRSLQIDKYLCDLLKEPLVRDVFVFSEINEIIRKYGDFETDGEKIIKKELTSETCSSYILKINLVYHVKDKKLNGELISYNQNGEIIARYNFRNNQLHGEFAEYDKNKIHQKGTFVQGKPDGEFFSYNEDGFPRKKVTYNKSDKPNGEMLLYYEGTDIVRDRNTLVNGKREGAAYTYYKSGKLKSAENYKNDKWDGEQIYYFENGNIVAKNIYKDGKKNGRWLTYNEQGIKTSETNYNMDRQHGKSELFNDDGSPRYSENYINSLRHGLQTYYEKDGTLKSQVNYIKGIRSGVEILYHKNGQVRAKYNYLNGKKEGDYTFYYDDGQISEHGFYHNDKFDGERMGYFKNDSKGHLLGRYANGKKIN